MAQIRMELTNTRITVENGYAIKDQLKARGYRFENSGLWVLDRSGAMTMDEARDMLLVVDHDGVVLGGGTGRSVSREKILAKLQG